MGKKLKLFFNKNKKGQIQSIVDTYKKIKILIFFTAKMTGFIQEVDLLKIH